ncbi:NAD-dependent epimerase/dehydratase family protein [Streptomyces pimonensis]|uniref:NAD-dependent epimerase/dehydratase family protein n=1 Tax=Streptomyces pimonensis TaxID=2860288 RepID=UPI0035287D05
MLGGTGWVGRHVCEAFARHGYRVLAVARKNPEHPVGHDFLSLDLAGASVRTVHGVLADARADVVVNATDAANATDGWDRSEAELRVANVRMVARLVEAAASVPRRPRLVHIGTIHEYGPIRDHTSVTESAVPRPVNAYARTKLEGSRTVLAAARSGEVDAVVLRLVNVCGPHPSPASFPGKLLALLREAAAGGRPELRVADSMRDWLDVRDAAAATLSAARHPVSGHTFNVGSGVAVHTRELVALGLRAAGLAASAVVERGGPVSSLGADWIQADVRKAAALLGWSPRIGLARSLRDMWEG